MHIHTTMNFITENYRVIKEYRNLAELLFAVFVSMIGFGLIAPLLPVYMRSFGATGMQLGVIMALFGLTRAMVSYPGGKFADKVGRKKLVSLGLLIYTVDMFLFGIATNLYQLFLFRAIQGAASGIVWPVATVMAADIVKPKHRGKAMGLFSMMWDLGLVLGPVIGGVLSDMFSMSTPFYFTSILAFSSCILIIFRVRETAHRKESDTAPVHRKKLTPYMKTFIGLCVAGFGTAFAMGFVQPVLSVYSNEILGLSKALIGITFGIMALFRLITKPIAGDLSDRHGKRIFILIGRSINSVFTFTIIYAWSFLSLIPSMILRGVGSGMGMPTANALTTSIAYKENRGKVMGWYSTARNIGLFMGPILGGWAYDNIGKTEPFILCGIVGMITVVVIFFTVFDPKEGLE